MPAEKEIKPLTLHDDKCKVIFKLYSWWTSLDRRTFVISQRWSDNNGKLQYLELLEVNNEKLKIVPYAEFFKQYDEGRISRASAGDDLPNPTLGAAARDLRPDRVF